MGLRWGPGGVQAWGPGLATTPCQNHTEGPGRQVGSGDCRCVTLGKCVNLSGT